MANQIARRLRKSLTPQEVKIWNHLRTWRKQGFHFRRQAPRRGYIVDFVCLKHRLVVEIDGGQHNLDPHRASDEQRDDEFGRAGFRVIRFWNSDVDLNLPGVLETIHVALVERRPHPAASGGHPPPAGEG
jgi:very-short-patch-repair endonuclease